MDSKLATISAALFPLPHRSVLEIAGAEATPFAQAQFMNDVRSLQDGHWQWNGVLNAKGRLLALFALLRLTQDRYWVLLHDAPTEWMKNHLQRYVFRTRVTLSPRADLAFAGCLGELPPSTTPGLGNRAGGTPEQSLRLDWGASRQLILGEGKPIATLPHLRPSANEAAIAYWNLLDIRLGLPTLDETQREAFTPHMLSLQRLNAFSLKKGCYPGQEIVARTHYLGQSKRALVRLLADERLRWGAAVKENGQDCGLIVTTASAASDHEALAVLTQPAGDGPWQVEGAIARAAPLQEGLAR